MFLNNDSTIITRQETAALRDFDPAYDRCGSKAEKLAVSIFRPDCPHEQT